MSQRTLNRRIIGPSPSEAFGFFTPGLLLVLALDLALLFAATALSTHAPLRPQHFYLHFFVHGKTPLPLRTTLIGISGSITAILLIRTLCWIRETWHFGWEAYRPWRIAAGLWGVVGVAVGTYLTSEATRIPTQRELAARAVTAAINGDGAVLQLALTYDCDLAESACRRLLRNEDASVRFEAAVYLYLYCRKGPQEKTAVARNAAWLRDLVFSGAGTAGVSMATLRRYARAFTLIASVSDQLAARPRDFSQEDPFWEEWARFLRVP